MVSADNIELKDFQEKAKLELVDLVTKKDCKQIITVKSPTGSGKTIMLIAFICDYIDKIDSNTAFVWFCPGKGDLEEQSRSKMQYFAPTRNTQNLFDALTYGFSAESTTFINWELVTKKGNTAIKEGEKKNLFDRIRQATLEGINFIIIIDEEHSNNTSKASDIINAFSAKNIIRVSATTVKNAKSEFLEIDELDVINAGLITKAVYVNEGIEDNVDVSNDYDTLLEIADNKRKEIAERYKSNGKKIRPLVLIQFPNGEPETIKAVEQKLSELGYTYENGLASIWMSEDKKDLPENLTANDSAPVFLLMKQAISTGWDCPRAKILVKLREGMSETFTIQTIGRIRRMPEAHHYDDDLLDFSYVYTFDEEYKAGLLSALDKAYETRRLFVKDKCKTFTLQKQLRDLDFDGLGERDVLDKIYKHFVSTYKLTSNLKDNKIRLETSGYVFDDEIFGTALKGKFAKTGELVIASPDTFIKTHKKVNTHKHGIELLHSVDEIKAIVGMTSSNVKTILERLFREDKNKNKKLVSLSTAEFYAFVVNNVHKLKEEFRLVTADMAKQGTFILQPKTAVFHIPEQDFYRYDPGVKKEIEYLSNAYKDYTSGFVTRVVRSTSEMLFEKWCEKQIDIDWVYKNGDTGQQYFSIVYIDGLQNQSLFYADYIVMKKDRSVWIIETKGGETNGKNKNIDIQIENKFNAFKDYAKNHNLNWGFVRDLDGDLFLNNTDFVMNMSDDNWKRIEDVL